MADGKIPVSEKRAKRIAVRHNGDDRDVLRMRAFAADLDGRCNACIRARVTISA